MQPNISDTAAITIRFVMPDEELAPFVTTLYHFEVGDIGGRTLEDWFHPEWANIRFLDEGRRDAAIGDGPMQEVPKTVLAGPTSMATRFRVGQGRSWGVGLLPLGWAKFCSSDAANYRDRICDASEEPDLSDLASVGEGILDAPMNVQREAELIQQRLRALLHRRINGEDRIAKVNAALVSPDISSVTEFAEHSAMSPRTLERLCRKVFGFPPKLLLRRQRFLRSLARYMLDPSMNWLDSLDSGYHDQAHFVRDFHRFMTMSPSAYAKQEHPILMAAMRGRMEAAGQAMQVLHEPASS